MYRGKALPVDPFDRLIVAQAKHGKMPLITYNSRLIKLVDDYIDLISDG
ncbi:PIN domain-containing protein [Erwinia sp. 198]